MNTRAGLRLLVATMIVFSGIAPLGILLATSLSRRWFYPDLVPAVTTVDAWREFLASGSQRDALWNSVALAVSTAVLATGLALPLGRAAALSTRGVRRTIALLAFFAVALPPMAIGVGLQLVVLALHVGGSLGGVLLAHLVPSVGYLTLVFLGVFTSWDRRLEETAAMCGADSWRRWTRVILPLLRRPIAEAMALGFLVSWAQVALTLLVGGGAVRTLPLDVIAMLQSGQDSRAAVGALVLTVPALLVLALSRAASRQTAAVVA